MSGHTEQQARELWCPMSRGRERHGFNTECVGAHCAAWRWTDREDPAATAPDAREFWPDEEDVDELRKGEQPRPATLPANYAWVPLTGEGEDIAGGFWREPNAAREQAIAEAKAMRRGYCGLAGSVS